MFSVYHTDEIVISLLKHICYNGLLAAKIGFNFLPEGPMTVGAKKQYKTQNENKVVQNTYSKYQFAVQYNLLNALIDSCVNKYYLTEGGVHNCDNCTVRYKL